MFNPTRSRIRKPDFLTAEPATGHACAVQIDDALRVAYGTVDLLVIEMPAGQTYARDLVRQIDRSAAVVYLNFGQYQNDLASQSDSVLLAANAHRAVTLRCGGLVTSYQDKDPALLAALLSASVAVIDEPDGALRNASYHVSRVLRWCVANISLSVMIVRDAAAVQALCNEHTLIRAVAVVPVPSDRTSSTKGMSPSAQMRSVSGALTQLLMRHLGNGRSQ